MTLFERFHMLHRVWRYRLREEKESIAYLLSQDLLGKTVLDIGANYGIYSYWMSKKVGKDGKVISFEPQPELGVFLKDMGKTFHLNNLTVVNKGVSSENGELTMIRGKVGSGGAQITKNADAAPENNERIKVDITTLDDYFKKHSVDSLAFIKCDVENHELQVFKGATQTLKKYSPTILFECHHKDAQEGSVFKILENLGYKGFFIHKGKKISVDQFEKYPYKKASNTHRNYIFTKA